MALLLVLAHTASEKVKLPYLIDLPLSIYIIAVPFFFLCSGYLFFIKIYSQDSNDGKHSLYLTFSKRILIMYALWSGIYFSFVLMDWLINGVSFAEVVRYFHISLVLTTYPTIWFLPALWIATTIVYFIVIHLNFSIRKFVLFSSFLYLCGGGFYSYASLFEVTNYISQIYTDWFITWRNGIFNGLVFVTLGAYIAKIKLQNFRFSYSLIGSLLFLILFVSEAFLMKSIISTSDANFIFMLIPFTFYFFILVCKIKVPNNSCYVFFRNMSMLIFLSQRLFLTAIPNILPKELIEPLSVNPYFGTLVYLAAPIVFSLLLIKFSRFYPNLRRLW